MGAQSQPPAATGAEKPTTLEYNPERGPTETRPVRLFVDVQRRRVGVSNPYGTPAESFTVPLDDLLDLLRKAAL